MTRQDRSPFGQEWPSLGVHLSSGLSSPLTRSSRITDDMAWRCRWNVAGPRSGKGVRLGLGSTARAGPHLRGRMEKPGPQQALVVWRYLQRALRGRNQAQKPPRRGCTRRCLRLSQVWFDHDAGGGPVVGGANNKDPSAVYGRTAAHHFTGSTLKFHEVGADDARRARSDRCSNAAGDRVDGLARRPRGARRRRARHRAPLGRPVRMVP
jgi:hypothetical protein